MSELDRYLPFADQPTPKAQEGEWTLIAPDGRRFTGPSPLQCAGAESKTRVPPQVALGRIARGLQEPSPEASATETARSDEPRIQEAALPQEPAERIFIDAGHLREVLNGNAMMVYASPAQDEQGRLAELHAVPRAGVQACRPEDRAILQTAAGRELVSKVRDALAAAPSAAQVKEKP